MAIQMTRAEYEATYGTPPLVASKPAPIKMTREQYRATYGTEPGVTGDRPGLGERLSAAGQKAGKARAEKLREISQAYKKGEQSYVTSGLQIGGELVGAALADPIISIFSALAPEPKEGAKPRKGFTESLQEGKGLGGMLVQKISDLPGFQEFAQTPQSRVVERDIEAINNYLLLLAPRGAVRGAKTPTTAIGAEARVPKTEIPKPPPPEASVRQPEVIGDVAPEVPPVAGAPGSAHIAIRTARQKAEASIQRVKEAVEEVSKKAKERAVEETTGPIGKAAAELRRKGIEEDVVDALKTTTESEASAVGKMTDIAERKSEKAFLVREQPKEVVGEVLLQRVNHLLEKSKGYKENITETIKNAKDIDGRILRADFINQARARGLGAVKNEKGKVIGFRRTSGSKVPVSDVKAYQTILSYIPDRIVPARSIHNIRSALFNEFNIAKARQKAFGTEGTNAVNQVRSRMIDAIESAGATGYRASVTEEAKILSALQDFVQLLGYKGKLEGLTTKSLKAGEIAQRVLGNAADRPQSIIDSVEAIAKETGFVAKEDLYKLIRISDIIEDVYGVSQTRGFSGSTTRGAVQAAEEIGAGAATGGLSGMLRAGIKFIRGQTDKEVRTAFGDLVRARLGAGGKVMPVLGKRNPYVPIQDLKNVQKGAKMPQEAQRAVPAPKTPPRGKQGATEGDFVYHTTSPKNLESIRKGGLKPSEGQYGKGVYFAPSMEQTGGYGAPEGAMIRVKRSKLPKDFQEFPEQGWTAENIPPLAIEISTDKGKTWGPLQTERASITRYTEKPAPVSRETPKPKGAVSRAVQKFKDTPNKKGGFVRIGSGEKIPVTRAYSGSFKNTDNFRGGTWYSEKGSKNYDFKKDYKGQVGGTKELSAELEIKNPLIIKNADMESGSFDVINSGYENFIPKKERALANRLGEVMYPSGDEVKTAEQTIREVLTENGNTKAEIDAVLNSTNKQDASMDLVIANGLRKEGYDALVLQNVNKGEIVDRHIFKIPEKVKRYTK